MISNMTDMYFLVYCQGEYEDYFESPTHVFTDMVSVKQQWEEIIAKQSAEEVEFQFIVSKLEDFDGYELNKLYCEQNTIKDVDFDDFLENPIHYTQVLAQFTPEQQDMFLTHQVLNARYNQLGGFSREYDMGHYKVDHYGVKPDGELFMYDTFYSIEDIPC